VETFKFIVPRSQDPEELKKLLRGQDGVESVHYIEKKRAMYVRIALPPVLAFVGKLTLLQTTK